jgi:hypothetical protein
VFFDHFKEFLPIPIWTRSSTVAVVKKGEAIEKNVVHISMPLTLEARSYHVIWAFGNYIHVSNVEEHLQHVTMV